MDFASAEHKQFYFNNLSSIHKNTDYEALVYTLGINPVCRDHFKEIYDVKNRCIIPESIHEPWQTGSSRSITRLAFNFYTCSVLETDSPADYSPKSLFGNLGEIQRHGALLALKYFA